MRLEVVVLGVSDVDRAKAFYAGIGWRVDGDGGEDGWRIVQMTPPGSAASVIFGSAVTAAASGAGGSLLFAVDDMEAAREELIRHGVDVSEPLHDAGGGLAGGFFAEPEHEAPGPDPEGRSYATYARFSDPQRQHVAASGDRRAAARPRRPGGLRRARRGRRRRGEQKMPPGQSARDVRRPATARCAARGSTGTATELVSEDGVRLIHLRFPRLAWPRQLGTGITSAEPGSVESLVSAVHDIEASRAAPVAPGIDVSEVFHDASRPRSQRPLGMRRAWQSGRDPARPVPPPGLGPRLR